MANAQVSFGGADCGEWVNGNDKNRTKNAWLLGYLSGINMAISKGTYDPLNKINSAPQIYLWMDNYCKANPLKTIREGGLDLYLELQKDK